MIYSAIKELGKIHSIVAFSEMLSVDRRTVSTAINSLEEKKLIKREGFTISLTQENN
jgi:Mn-dependent DtxR family transcriptional regulator